MTRKRPLPTVTDPADQTVAVRADADPVLFQDPGEPIRELDTTGMRDPSELLAELADQARNSNGDPTPFAAGTFAFYAMSDGGLMTVFDVDESSRLGTPGVQRMRIPPGLIRAMNVLMSGGSRMQAVKAMVTGRRRELPNGQG